MTSQISRPYQFALVGVLLGAILWFVALRGGDETPATAPPPPAGAAAPAPGTPPAAAPAPGAQAAPGAPAAPASPAAAPSGQAQPAETPDLEAGDRSARILDALADGDVAVLLFHEPKASDDREVRSAVRSVDRRGGRVAVFDAPVDDVGRYAAITRGVDVRSAPTTLVIGPDRKARAIVGFTDVKEIDELVDDVLHVTR